MKATYHFKMLFTKKYRIIKAYSRLTNDAKGYILQEKIILFWTDINGIFLTVDEAKEYLEDYKKDFVAWKSY